MQNWICRITILMVFGAYQVVGQNARVILGPDEIGENQAWTITVSVQNDRLKSYDNFPDIEGFRKRGTSNQSSTSIINGQVSSSQSVIMTYAPTRQGTFTIPSFIMKVNDKPISVQGKKVKVGPAVQQQRDPFQNYFDRPDDFFGRGETEFVDVKDEAFVALTTNKDEVYVGEGFNVTISFFVAATNQAYLQFYEPGKQLSEILKKVKPSTCWEENFSIENIEAEGVTIGGKEYNQYKIYQATFYPLNAEPINFPAFDLEMIKYKVARNPSFFGQNRKEDFKKFTSKPKKVKVKELPPHPLKNIVGVGDYRLEERVQAPVVETGTSTTYEFSIYGEGNISGIAKPAVKGDEKFEFYEPNVRQEINRQKNRVTGTKSFTYFMIPKEPGDHKLKDYFKWVFFNPKTAKYDTLQSAITLHVTGESRKNEDIESNDLGSFYDQINGADNTLQASTTNHWHKWIFNGLVVLLLGAAVWLAIKK